MTAGEGDDVTRFMGDLGTTPERDRTDFVLDESIAVEKRPLLGDYQILERIGAGGMGQVFRARHRTMQRDVALKILPKRFSKQGVLVDRFYAEVRAIAKLMHPNIVTAFDAGCVSSIHYLVMELVDGVSLSQQVSQQGVLTLEQAVQFLSQAGSALHYAHSQGVIHRDIKPGNMMCTKERVLKILDFGLAQLAQEVERENPTKQLVGTVEYMSPEQINHSHNIDHRTDLYSLGASLFYLLTGRSMFSGEPVQVALGHLKKAPPALYEVRGDIDLRLDSIFQRLVAKNPDERFESGQALIDQLSILHLTSTAESQSLPHRRLPMLPNEPITHRPSSESTSQRRFSPFGLELGMTHSRVSILTDQRDLIEVPVDGNRMTMRNMVWSDGEQIAIGESASQLRATQPNHIFYGFQRWFGIPMLERGFAGRQTPPEVLLGVVLRKMLEATRRKLSDASHAVINIPSCYDQLHRQSILASARCAGIEILQLLDRPLAAGLAFLETKQRLGLTSTSQSSNDVWLYLSLQTGVAEASLLQAEEQVVRTLGTHGDWKLGIARWQSRIADTMVRMFQEKHGIDVRLDMLAASRLQRSVELALDRLIVVQQVELRYEFKQKEIRWVLTREELYRLCQDLFSELIQFGKMVIANADIDPQSIRHILLSGDLLSISPFKEILKKSFPHGAVHETISKSDLARGAALQSKYLMPPSDSTGPHAETRSIYDIGFVSIDETGAASVPKILIPKGSSLPTNSSRTLRFSQNSTRPPKIQFVESTRFGQTNWHRLGVVEPSRAFSGRPSEHPLQLRLELDASGLLASKLTWLAGNSQIAIPPLADPGLDDGSINQWKNWIETIILCHSDPQSDGTDD